MLGLSLTELKKQYTPREINAFYKNRAQQYNTQLNAYLTLSQESSQDVIDVAIKDNFNTIGIRTTASSRVLDQYIAPYDATVIEKLKNAGYGVQGKTNMDAWAHGSSTETSDYGPSKNPWDLKRVPGGSSGGSAVAVAAGCTPYAIGSETAGSIRLPASWCGIVGFKGTYGRVSRYGVIAMGSSLDCPGPMTTNITDAAEIMQVIAGHDPYDATSARVSVPNYVSYLGKNTKMKIGISRSFINGCDSEVITAFENTITLLQKQGHTIIDVTLLDPQYAISDYTIIQRAEVSSNLARYDGVRYGTGRDIFGYEAKRRMMLGAYVLAHGYYDAYYKKAQKVRTAIIEDFKKAFATVDVIVTPTTPITALRIGESAQYPFFGEMMDKLAEPSAMAGLPAVALPCGLDSKGLPIGIQIMAPQFEEPRLFDIASQYESLTDHYFGIITQGFTKWK